MASFKNEFNADYGLDRFTLSNLLQAKEMQKSRLDVVGIIVGMEGVGKSSLALKLCSLMDDNFKPHTHVCYTPEEFNFQIIKLPNRSAIIGDEAISMLYNRRAMASSNVQVTEMLAKIRSREHFIIFCIPDLSTIDKYLRTHRARFVIQITERGVFNFYGLDKLKKIRKDPKADRLIFPRPTYKGIFSKIDENSQLWIDYENKKNKYVQSDVSLKVIKEKAKRRKQLEKCYTLRHIAEIESTKKRTVQDWYYKYKVFNKKHCYIDNMGQVRISKVGYKKGMKLLKKLKNTKGGITKRVKHLKEKEKAKRKRSRARRKARILSHNKTPTVSSNPSVKKSLKKKPKAKVKIKKRSK